jgi:hypothetical protein
MTTQDVKANSGPSAGFWTIRHVAFGLGGLGLVIVLMVRSCGGDESDKQAGGDDDLPRQAIVVQIPASQWPSQPAPPVQSPAPRQPAYGYIPPQQDYNYSARPQVPAQSQPPADDGSNPWAVPSQAPGYSQSGGYRQPVEARWGEQLRPRQPQQHYVQPQQGGARYRPLDEPDDRQASSRKLPEPVQGYYPVAPYDRPAGSSFGAPDPYAGAYGGYPGGYYGSGVYGLPGSGYGVPVAPGIGWRPGW